MRTTPLKAPPIQLRLSVARRVGPDDVGRPIGGAIVDHDDLELGVRLRADRSQRAVEVVRAIANGEDD